MGIMKVKALEITCDACGARQVVTDPIDIIGYSGAVTEQNESGGSGSIPFFACTAKCLQSAIESAIERSYK